MAAVLPRLTKRPALGKISSQMMASRIAKRAVSAILVIFIEISLLLANRGFLSCKE